FFCDQVLHRGVVEGQLGVHPLELGVLGLELLHASQFGRLHAAVLRLPLVIGRRADPRLPAQVFDRHPGVALLEHGNDLGLGELRLLHTTSWRGKDARKFYLLGVYRPGKLTMEPPGWKDARKLYFWGVRDQGELTMAEFSSRCC